MYEVLHKDTIKS